MKRSQRYKNMYEFLCVKHSGRPLLPRERIAFYEIAFPKFPPLTVGTDGRIQGIWVMGNNYTTGSSLYGAYPYGYLDRITSLFPDCKTVLHLFSGSMKKSVNYIRFDVKKADVNGDAEELSGYFKFNVFDIIYADPPYSVEDTEHYGTPMINRNKVLRECVKVVRMGGYIVWLDQVLPMYRKTELKIIGLIGMVKSTNHRFRVVTIFQKI